MKFDPPELQEKLLKAFDVLSETLWTDWHDLSNPPDDEEPIITAETLIEEISLNTYEDNFQATVSTIVEWADIVQRFKVRDRTVLRTERYTLFHVSPAGVDEFRFTERLQGKGLSCAVKVSIDGASFEIGLTVGISVFGVFIDAQDENDEHNPSFSDYTTLVRVNHPPSASDAIVRQVADAYLFELAATRDLLLPIEPYPSGTALEPDERRPTPRRSVLPLPKLALGPGLQDVQQLYVQGCVANPAEYALIHFVKVLEYVSATVVRVARHDALRKRLASRQALNPDARFLEDLAALVEDQRLFTKDAEALKLTLQTCCDPVLLAQDSPKFLSTLHALRESDDAKKKRLALDELSASLSATRNQLSHAKANYQLTGQECPAGQLVELTACARSAAAQAIKWFSRVPPNARVTT